MPTDPRRLRDRDTVSLPGPTLSVSEGDTVTIAVTNALPAGTTDVPHALRFEVPGITFDRRPDGRRRSARP